jgi:hypothetical protein
MQLKIAKAPMAAAAITEFKKLENTTFDISVKLMELGIGNRVDATPFAALAAADLYNAALKKSQRGYVIDADGEKYAFDRATKQGNAAYMAMYRWLDALYSVPKGNETRDESSKKKFDASRLAKQLKAKYTKAQLAKLIAELQ